MKKYVNQLIKVLFYRKYKACGEVILYAPPWCRPRYQFEELETVEIVTYSYRKAYKLAQEYFAKHYVGGVHIHITNV